MKKKLAQKIKQFKEELQLVQEHGFIVRMDEYCYKNPFDQIIPAGMEIFFQDVVDDSHLIQIKNYIESMYGFELVDITGLCGTNKVKIVLIRYGYEE